MQFDIKELPAVYHKQKSYYGKAMVIFTHDNRIVLRSYETNVASFHLDKQKLLINGYFSSTTARHQSDFMLQFIPDFFEVAELITKKENFKTLKAFLESIEEIDFMNKSYILKNDVGLSLNFY